MTTKEKELISVPEVALRLGINKLTAYRCVRNGTIPVLRFGKKMFVSVAMLDRMIQTGSNAVDEIHPCKCCKTEVDSNLGGNN